MKRRHHGGELRERECEFEVEGFNYVSDLVLPFSINFETGLLTFVFVRYFPPDFENT